MRRLWLLLVAGCMAAGQVWQSPNVATNYDGSVVYFSSALVMRGSGQHAWEKIFRWTEREGITLYEERAPTEWQRGGQIYWEGRPAYRLISPTVSDDASVVGFTRLMDCFFGSICASGIELFSTTIRLPGRVERVVPGSARVSGNGRFAYSHSSMNQEKPGGWWLDVASGVSFRYEDYCTATNGSHPITDGGFVLRRVGCQVPTTGSLWKPSAGFISGGDVALPGFHGFDSALMSRDGKVILSSLSTGPDGFALLVYDTARGQESMAPVRTGVLVDISADGGTLLADSFGGDEIPGFRVVHVQGAAALSGDARVVYAWRGKGLVRVEVESGRERVIVPPVLNPNVPFLVPADASDRDRTVAPGSLLKLQWVGAPPPLNGGKPLYARFGREVWPIVRADGTTVFVHVPFDAELDSAGKDLQFVFPATDEMGPFEPVSVSWPWKVARVAPISTGGAAHEDWRGTVSGGDPAKTLEVLHLFGTGFGAVDSRGWSIAPVECWLQAGVVRVTAEVLYAGLAPDLLPGAYQVDVRTPNMAGELSCSVGGKVFTGSIRVVWR